MISTKHRRSSRILAGLTAAAAVVMLSACSSGGSDDTSDAGGAAGGGGAASADTPTLDALFKGSVGAPPTSSPAAAKGKTV